MTNASGALVEFDLERSREADAVGLLEDKIQDTLQSYEVHAFKEFFKVLDKLQQLQEARLSNPH